MSRQPRVTKGTLHPRNRHNGSYNFDELIEAYAPLREFVAPNKYGNLSINFFLPEAVKALNAALLALYYGVEWWQTPSTTLTPPIPGRADYIHHIAQVVGSASRVLDVGVGASCIYPIIGRAEYGWSFVGSDISRSSLDSAREIVERNTLLRGGVELREQRDPSRIFEGIIEAGELFDLTICNPPFHSSEQDARRAAERKLRGLKALKGGKGGAVLNFSGSDNELWCEGGERAFVERMIIESRLFARQCRWFSSLRSNEDNLTPLRRKLSEVGAKELRVIEMEQGNKRSRILAWRY